ncbi:uncharacterized protein LOC143026179 [Oratosquilla oratoria]|uniref:uncharacterized protein LOC143026179 n=1 Tax=Oratosquilla oratoria TaxID=337810 RepID=UPI003F76340D
MPAPPLLPPRPGVLHAVSSWCRRSYRSVSRTRPIVTARRCSSRTGGGAPRPNPPPGIWGDCGRGLVELVYRGLAQVAPVGVTYVVGVVGGSVAGAAVSSSLLVAAVTSLLTGFCLCELVTWSGPSSGNAYTATYQLVGELPAFTLGFLNLLFHASVFAAVGKAMAATMDFTTGGKLAAFLRGALGTLPVSRAPPDLFAAGSVLVTTVLLMLGLEQSGFLRLVMMGSSAVAFLFFLTVGSLHTQPDETLHHVGNLTHSYHHGLSAASSELLAGAAICCILYTSCYVMSARVKSHGRPHRSLPLATSLAVGLAFLAFFALGIVVTLMASTTVLRSGAPLLKVLQLREAPVWTRLTLGALQVVILCIALVEAALPLCRQLVALAGDGLLPTVLAHECRRTHAPSQAFLVGGGAASLLALLVDHVALLEIAATSVLAMNTLLVFIVMYRRHRCSYGSLCSVAVTPTSSAPYSYHRLRSNTQKQERTLQFLKDGLRVLPMRYRSPFSATQQPPKATSSGGGGYVSLATEDETRDSMPLLEREEVEYGPEEEEEEEVDNAPQGGESSKRTERHRGGNVVTKGVSDITGDGSGGDVLTSDHLTNDVSGVVRSDDFGSGVVCDVGSVGNGAPVGGNGGSDGLTDILLSEDTKDGDNITKEAVATNDVVRDVGSLSDTANGATNIDDVGNSGGVGSTSVSDNTLPVGNPLSGVSEPPNEVNWDISDTKLTTDDVGAGISGDVMTTTTESPKAEPSGAEAQKPPSGAPDSPSDSAGSGYGTDTETDSDTDIDAAVAEYQEKLRVATLDSGTPRAPTPESARRALLSLVGLFLTILTSVTAIVFGYGSNEVLLVMMQCACLVVGVAFLVVLARQPSLRPSTSTAFVVPASPGLPASALLLNTIMLVQVVRHSWPLVLPYTVAGFLGYAFYSSTHSALALRQVALQPSLTSQVIFLEPLATPSVTSTLLQSPSPPPGSSSSRGRPPSSSRLRPQQATHRLTQVDTVLITR